MAEITFILGGTRSGKSEYAEKMAIDTSEKVAYFATCISNDEEMDQRILAHKNRRPANWKTIETPYDICSALNQIDTEFKTVLIDCLTIFTSNLLLQELNESEILKKIDLMIKTLKEKNFKAIIVSNEVGLGIVPESSLGREFRDIAGKVNQLVAREADNVFFVVSGIPVKIK